MIWSRSWLWRRLLADARQGLGHILGFDLAAGARVASSAGGGKPQRLRLQFEQPWPQWCGIAKLKAQLDGGQTRRRPRQQQVAVAHRVQRRRAAEGAADLIAADGLAHMMHHNQRRSRGIAQPQQALAQRGHGARVVLILIVGEIQGIQNDHFGRGLACGYEKMIQALRAR
jgi:hypothetical protein